MSENSEEQNVNPQNVEIEFTEEDNYVDKSPVTPGEEPIQDEPIEFTDEELAGITVRHQLEGVPFRVDDYMGIRKNDPEFTYKVYREEFLFDEAFSKIIDEETFKEDYDEAVPFTAMECLQKFKDNSAELMVALKFIGPEKMKEHLGSEIISEETITKTQKKARLKNPDIKEMLSRSNDKSVPADAFEEVDIVYEDTYILHRISQEKLAEHNVKLEEDILFVECICPSQKNHYFLFVPAAEEQCQTAKGAIAWTFTDEEGKTLSVEEWEHMAYHGKEC